jgi:hypothetical protein
MEECFERLLDIPALLPELADLSEHFFDADAELLRIDLHLLKENGGRVLSGGYQRVHEVLRADVGVTVFVRGHDGLLDDIVERDGEAVLDVPALVAC